MKKLLTLTLALALVLSFSPALFASAADNQHYFLVEGYVTPDGGGEIVRIELVDDILIVKSTPGTEYAISAINGGRGAYREAIANYPFGVSFETAPDLPFAQLDEARFAVLVPLVGVIFEFDLVDRAGRVISNAQVYAREGEVSLDVRETEAGFELRWDDNSADPSLLDFDVYALSEITGEKNVLAYRTQEWELFVPYEWLEPDDLVVFVLKCNDGTSTLTAESEAFYTPAGEAKDILDDEAWEPGDLPEEDDIPDWLVNLFLIFLFLVLPAGLIVLLVVFLKKRKRKKLAQ
ncbi:MAG: hypothetical protein FWE98_05070 [Oscillospiraceae bacterium]|nr:hypothetical protein [Oscillospiraceae bacterium]